MNNTLCKIVATGALVGGLAVVSAVPTRPPRDGMLRLQPGWRPGFWAVRRLAADMLHIRATAIRHTAGTTAALVLPMATTAATTDRTGTVITVTIGTGSPTGTPP
jgi:hypothetical protein